MKMRWQTIASNVSIRTISPTATPLPKAYDCVAVYIAGRRTSLVVYGWWPQPPTKKVAAMFDPSSADPIHTVFETQSKSCRSSCLESQIINIKLKKTQQKVPGPPPKLSASDRRTCGNFQHCIHIRDSELVIIVPADALTTNDADYKVRHDLCRYLCPICSLW